MANRYSNQNVDKAHRVLTYVFLGKVVFLYVESIIFHMANEQNLAPHKLTKNNERTRKIATNGGKASGVARRKKKSMRESMEILMNMAMKGGKVDSLEDIATFGKASKGVNLTCAEQLNVVVMKKALKGDPKFIALAREILGVTEETNVVSPLEKMTKTINLYKDLDDEDDDDGEETE